MSTLGLICGQLLPWLIGAAWLACLWRNDAPGRGAMVAGYGYLIGSFALTLWMRALSALGIAFGWLSIALPLLTFAIVAYWLRARRDRIPLPRMRLDRQAIALGGEASRLYLVLWFLLATLIVIHLLLAGLEIIWRPVFPWDAWSQWATKARVWYEMQHMVPFVDAGSWPGGQAYTDASPGYPANVPLLQVWACIALGRWDDSLMNLPWVSFAGALALAFYGQLRVAGRGPLFALAGAYLAISMPLLETHVALAGYADLPLASYYGMSAIALWQWANTRDRRQLLLAAALAAALPLTKNPGWAWLATLVPVVIVTLLPKHGLRIVYALWAAVIPVLLILGRYDFVLLGYHLHTAFEPVWEPLWQNYYEFANWHLLWYLLPALVALNYRRVLTPPLVPGTVMVATGLGFLFVVFSFTNAALWVSDFSTVNRATLHLAPLLVYYLLALAHAGVEAARERSGHASRPAEPTGEIRQAVK